MLMLIFRTIVSVTSIFNIELLRPVDKLKVFCEGLHLFVFNLLFLLFTDTDLTCRPFSLYECNCEYHPKETNEVCWEYMVSCGAVRERR